VPKQNYHQVRKQKEQARKTRQQEKQQRGATRPGHPGESVETRVTVLPALLADNRTSGGVM
jgi:hypothetical protein